MAFRRVEKCVGGNSTASTEFSRLSKIISLSSSQGKDDKSVEVCCFSPRCIFQVSLSDIFVFFDIVLSSWDESQNFRVLSWRRIQFSYEFETNFAFSPSHTLWSKMESQEIEFIFYSPSSVMNNQILNERNGTEICFDRKLSS